MKEYTISFNSHVNQMNPIVNYIKTHTIMVDPRRLIDFHISTIDDKKKIGSR